MIAVTISVGQKVVYDTIIVGENNSDKCQKAKMRHNSTLYYLTYIAKEQNYKKLESHKPFPTKTLKSQNHHQMLDHRAL